MSRARAATQAAAWLPWLLLALFTSPCVRAESLELIALHYRTAEDLLPILRPLVPQGAALSGTGDMLLVRADAATVATRATAGRHPVS